MKNKLNNSSAENFPM